MAGRFNYLSAFFYRKLRKRLYTMKYKYNNVSY